MKRCPSSAWVAMSLLLVLLGTGTGVAAAVLIPADARVSARIVEPGLRGEFFDRNDPPNVVNSLAVADAIIASSAPAATFVSTSVDYPSGFADILFLPRLDILLGTDAGTLSPIHAAGLAASPMVVRLRGVIEIAAAFDIDPTNDTIDIRFALGSDDGSRLRVGGQTVISIDGTDVFFRYPPAQIAIASFEAPGLYPVELVWYDHYGGIGIEWYSSIPGGWSSGAPAGTAGIVPPSILGFVPHRGGLDRFVNPSATCPGTATGPEYNTIQEAIDASAPGDVITVCPGTYDENVVVHVANVALLGIPPVILQPAAPGSPCLDVAADDIEVRRLRIRGCDVGLQIRAHRALVGNNIVHDAAVAAVHVAGAGGTVSVPGPATSNVVMNNLFHDNAVGVYVTGAADGTAIKNNTFRNHDAAGVSLDRARGVGITKNAVSRTTGPGIDAYGVTNCVISFNSVAFNAAGIGLTQASGCVITRNNVTRQLDPTSPIADCSWDGFGLNTFWRNTCDSEAPPGAWD